MLRPCRRGARLGALAAIDRNHVQHGQAPPEKGDAVQFALANARALRNSVQTQQLVTLTGRLSPSEAPLLEYGKVLKSLALGQLLNLLEPEAGGSGIAAASQLLYPLFLLQPGHHPATTLQDLTFAPLATEAQINWLSAFYAVEWTVFCGFSVFLWWRLVRDAQLLEAQTPSQTEG